jgi:hypothetical protein
MPEQRYRHDDARQRIIKRITTTPGTFAYTGPVLVGGSDTAVNGNSATAVTPTKLVEALEKAKSWETSQQR